MQRVAGNQTQVTGRIINRDEGEGGGTWRPALGPARRDGADLSLQTSRLPNLRKVGARRRIVPARSCRETEQGEHTGGTSVWFHGFS